mmetsp:Transcript_96629/g.288518  ORF Transcript_96629/g.288518 Transcript_96629/m.288518 type:complete len:337 (+) Transcript_96629:63-1073(+)
MFEFLRESLLCSSDDSPKRGLNPRRRPGEVISSQGAPGHPERQLQPLGLPGALIGPYERQLARRTSSRSGGNGARRGTPSPLPSRWTSSGSPRSSFRTAPSFREAFGGSLPYTGAAAAQEETLPGRGLYVPMQRGIGQRGASRPPVRRTRSPTRGEEGEAGPGTRSGSLVRCSTDPSPAVVNGACPTPAGGSFEQHEAIRQVSAASFAPWVGGGSLLLNGSETCSLLPGRDGSFYAVQNRGDPRLEAMQAAGAPPPAVAQTPLPAPPPGQVLCAVPSTPMYVTAAQGLPAPQQRNGICTPTLPAARPAPPLVQRQSATGQILGHAGFAPSFVAVHD